MPTSTPSVADTAQPIFVSAGFDPDPPDNGGLCTIEIEDTHWIDPAYSSGIEEVWARLSVNDGPWEYFTDELSLISGGFVDGYGSEFNAIYGGTLEPETPISTGDTVLIEIKAHDADNDVWVVSPPFEYVWGCDCP